MATFLQVRAVRHVRLRCLLVRCVQLRVLAKAVSKVTTWTLHVSCALLRLLYPTVCCATLLAFVSTARVGTIWTRMYATYALQCCQIANSARVQLSALTVQAATISLPTLAWFARVPFLAASSVHPRPTAPSAKAVTTSVVPPVLHVRELVARYVTQSLQLTASPAAAATTCLALSA